MLRDTDYLVITNVRGEYTVSGMTGECFSGGCLYQSPWNLPGQRT